MFLGMLPSLWEDADDTDISVSVLQCGSLPPFILGVGSVYRSDGQSAFHIPLIVIYLEAHDKRLPVRVVSESLGRISRNKLSLSPEVFGCGMR